MNYLIIENTGKYDDDNYEIVRAYVLDHKFEVVEEIPQCWDRSGNFHPKVLMAKRKYSLKLRSLDPQDVFPCSSFEQGIKDLRMATLHKKPKDSWTNEDYELLEESLQNLLQKYPDMKGLTQQKP